MGSESTVVKNVHSDVSIDIIYVQIWYRNDI